MEVWWAKCDARWCAFDLLVQPGRLGRGFELCMVNGWARGASQTEVVWPWHHYFYDIWSTLGDECHGGEDLLTNAVVYHVRGEVMINTVGYEDPMVYF